MSLPLRPDARMPGARPAVDAAMAIDVQDRIGGILAPTVGAMGYELVRIRLSGGGRRTLQVMVERTDRADVTFEDCAAVSRAISALLDVEDPIDGSYDLEVSSPGIDRPLVRLADFERFSGFEAKIELRRPVDGRRRLRGTLLGVAGGDTISVGLDGVGVAIPYSDIRAAQLVLTDSLIEASRARRL